MVFHKIQWNFIKRKDVNECFHGYLIVQRRGETNYRQQTVVFIQRGINLSRIVELRELNNFCGMKQITKGPNSVSPQR